MNETKFLTIIQARMGSTRLSGKVLKPLAGKPLLEHCVRRVQATTIPTHVVVATTVLLEDDAIVDLCRDLKVDCFRGDEADVLDRFWQCSSAHSYPYIVRVTADNPFVEPLIIDQALRLMLAQDCDYVGNKVKPTFPIGLDIEVFKKQALHRAWLDAKSSMDREHVTFYIWNRPQQFKLHNFENEVNLSHLRWTVDYPEDFLFADKVYRELYKEGQIFHMPDVLNLLKQQPDLISLYQHKSWILNDQFF